MSLTWSSWGITVIILSGWDTGPLLITPQQSIKLPQQFTSTHWWNNLVKWGLWELLSRARLFKAWLSYPRDKENFDFTLICNFLVTNREVFCLYYIHTYTFCPSVLSCGNLKVHQILEVKSVFKYENVMLQLTFNPGLTLTGFQTTRPWSTTQLPWGLTH